MKSLAAFVYDVRWELRLRLLEMVCARIGHRWYVHDRSTQVPNAALVSCFRCNGSGYLSLRPERGMLDQTICNFKHGWERAGR